MQEALQALQRARLAGLPQAAHTQSIAQSGGMLARMQVARDLLNVAVQGLLQLTQVSRKDQDLAEGRGETFSRRQLAPGC